MEIKSENGLGKRKTKGSAEHQMTEERLYNLFINKRDHKATMP